MRDSYDDCVAHLDEYLGRLIDELERRGVLERTWVIIAGDHGESFGEHPGIFCHGMSLYQTEVHVPLLIVPPRRGPAPATDFRSREPPRPAANGRGRARPRSWLTLPGSIPGPVLERGAGRSEPADRALSEVVPTDSFTRDPSKVLNSSPPLAALAEGDWTYIRREGDVREELFDVRTDPKQARDLARDSAAQPKLEQMRTSLGRFTAGPLTRERFRP